MCWRRHRSGAGTGGSPAAGRAGRVCGLGGIDGRLVAVAAEGPLQDADGPGPQVGEAQERLGRLHRASWRSSTGSRSCCCSTGTAGRTRTSGQQGLPVPARRETRSETLFRLLDQSPVIVGVTGPVAGVTSGRVAASPLLGDGAERPGVRRLPDGRCGDWTRRRQPRSAAPRYAGHPVGHGRQRGRRRGRALRPDPDRPVLPADATSMRSAPCLDAATLPTARCDELLDIVPERPPAAPSTRQQMIEAVVDDGSFFQLAPPTAARWWPAWPGSPARPSGVLAATPTSTPGRWTCRPARSRPASPSCATPSTCRWCTSPTSPAS